MAENKYIFAIIGIAVVLILFFSATKIGIVTKEGEKPTDFNLGGGDKETAVSAHFADKNFNEVELTPRDESGLMSTVEIGGALPESGIFFMRFDVDVTNQGTLSKTFSITDAKIENANGVKLQDSIVRTSFSCILNKPKALLAGASALWKTDSDDPATGCSSLVWMPTSLFEAEIQPLKLIVTIKSEFTLFGISREAITTKELIISITKDDGSFGSALVNLIGGSSGFVKECDGTIPETTLCPGADVIGSVCQGLSQVCTVDGLWPGCPTQVYGANYTPGMESSGNALSSFLVTCKDGLDNDCDGFKDKPDINGGCASGICDYDCPIAFVKFRTNAYLLDGETISDFAQQGIWISLNTGEGLLKSYGYDKTASVGGSPCDNIGIGCDAKTPADTYCVRISSAYDKASITYDPDGNIGNGCFQAIFSSSDLDRCKVGDTYYPSCISLFPISTPFGLGLQETLVNY